MRKPVFITSYDAKLVTTRGDGVSSDSSGDLWRTASSGVDGARRPGDDVADRFLCRLVRRALGDSTVSVFIRGLSYWVMFSEGIFFFLVLPIVFQRIVVSSRGCTVFPLWRCS